MMNIDGHARVVVDEENKNIKGKIGKIIKYNPIKHSCLLDFGLYQDEVKYENLEMLKEENQTGKYQERGRKLGEKVDEKNEAYGDSFNKTAEIIKQFLQDYKNNDGTYTIPAEMIEVISRQTRIIDKQSRIFNNPKQDLMGENPYKDIAGYGLLAMDSGSND